jgi:penicillin-binding protein 2
MLEDVDDLDEAQDEGPFRGRIVVVVVVMVLLTVALVTRLAYLQLTRHEHYTTLALGNRVKVVPIAPVRGRIFSREGIVLADNHPSFVLQVNPDEATEIPQRVERLRELIEVPDEDLHRFYKLLKQKRRFDSIPLRFNLTEDEISRFEVNRYQYPGFSVVVNLNRVYPLAAELAHVIGYVGRIDEPELQHLDATEYAASTHIGKTGVEKGHEADLHGHVGLNQVEVDAHGNLVRVLDHRDPVPGKNLYLTLDLNLQRLAANLIGKHRGAVVAIEPATGAVLAMVSRPEYDPNPFVNGMDVASFRTLNDSEDRPMYNRALQGTYPPGSTIKPMMAMAALHHGVRTPSASTYCPGWYSVKGDKHKFRCWASRGHGSVALERAIAQSCDVYFYDLAFDLGIDRMHDYLSQFGFGERTGIDIAGESGGVLPSRAWKLARRKRDWLPAETIIAGIGQGYFLATPLQMAHAVGIVGQKGHGRPPRVVGWTEDQLANAIKPVDLTDWPDVEAKRKEYWDIVVRAMEKVVRAGTASRIGGAPYRFAGKTGTAQVRGIKQGESYRANAVPERYRDHAWFIAFAPVENPKIAVAVLVENGGHGGGTAAPIARALMDNFLLPGRPVQVPKVKPRARRVR